MQTLQCFICKADIQNPNEKQTVAARRQKNVYCGDEHMKEYRRRVSSETMARTNHKYASARMKANNPMRRPEVRESVSVALRAIGHRPVIRGGNGKEIPKPQARLAKALRWRTEVVVHTKQPKVSGYPGTYKIDIANTAYKIGIEVDGPSHCALIRQAQDRKKEALLSSLGWTILRFTNRQVTDDLAGCVRTVLSTISKLHTTTTTTPAEF